MDLPSSELSRRPWRCWSCFLFTIGIAVISCIAAMGIVWLAWSGHRSQWDAGVMLEFLLGTHVLVFIAGRIFHNNYLIWILPLVGLMAADALNPKQEAAEAGD